ncbi:MAG: TolC family outer membrane protein [Rubrivivax sp.]|nr:TolC family outer membrane protein [Rubrivivax sp.]
MRRSPFRRRLSALVLAAGALIAHASPLHAQNLAELYEAARSFDATYLAARAQADAATYRRAQADALRLPNVGLQASASRSLTDPPDSPSLPDRGYGNVTGGTLTGRQPLFNRTNSTTIEQADRLLEIANLELRLAEQDLIARLSQAYFDVLVAIETLNSTRTAKAAFAEQLAAAQRSFEVGTATITDAREAQSRFDLARAREIQAENDLRSKQIALDQLVGRPNVQPKPLLLPASLSGTVPGSIDDWVTLAEGSHPVIRRAQLALDVAQIEIDKAKAGHLPTVDLVAQLQHQYNSNVVGLGTGIGRLPGHYTNGLVGVQLNLPLYAGNSVQNRVREVLALEEKARNDLDAARRGVTQSTRQAYIGFRSFEAEVAALEAAEASSRLALEATQVGFRVGVRVNVDVLNAQTQLFQTQRDLAAARYAVLLGAVRLRQASGTLQQQDLELISRLLQP